MTINMTEDIRRALAKQGEEPLRLIDPTDGEAYILLSANEYDRLAATREQILGESYPLQEAVARKEGWDDPAMDDYDNYDAQRSGAA